MNGQKQWTRLAVMALLVLTLMTAEGGKADKQGEPCELKLDSYSSMISLSQRLLFQQCPSQQLIYFDITIKHVYKN